MKTFSEAFVEHLERTGTKVTEVSEKSGVAKDALYALKRGTTRNMAVDDAIRVARSFDMNVEEFMGLCPRQVRNGLAQQVAQLTDREQALLEASLGTLLSPLLHSQGSASAVASEPSGVQKGER